MLGPVCGSVHKCLVLYYYLGVWANVLSCTLECGHMIGPVYKSVGKCFAL
jgi:hypothetical protein